MPTQKNSPTNTAFDLKPILLAVWFEMCYERYLDYYTSVNDKKFPLLTRQEFPILRWPLQQYRSYMRSVALWRQRQRHEGGYMNKHGDKRHHKIPPPLVIS